jgi:hypothetical protein
MKDALDAPRQKIIEELLAGREVKEVGELARLLRKFADDALGWVNTSERHSEVFVCNALR